MSLDHTDANAYWPEKYRPKTVQDCILPDHLKDTFQAFVDKGEVPNMILSGRSGVGKTTVAIAVLEEIGIDWLKINASIDLDKDALRTKIQGFATTVSLVESGRKMVLGDEFDGTSPEHVQKPMRAFTEEFSHNCGFILTCNYLNKIIPALQSRFSVVNFTITKEEMPGLAAQFMTRACEILDLEGITYDKKAVGALVARYMPDWRKVLNELELYSANGEIDSGILVQVGTHEIGDLVGFIKKKDYTSMRKWVASTRMDFADILRAFFDQSYHYVEKDSIPTLTLILADYQSRIVIDPEINTVAMATEIMLEVDFK